MLLMIDNYDSFTYNLVQYFGELGEDVRVVRNDEITRRRHRRAAARPAGAVARAVLAGRGRHLRRRRSSAFAGKLPILGVCLGHQAIGAALGGTHRARAGADARQGEHASPPTSKGVYAGAAAALRRDPLPLAGDRARVAARRSSTSPRRRRTARSWACATANSRHGDAARRRAVPPRIDPHRARPRDAEELPGSGAMTKHRSICAATPSRGRPRAMRDAMVARRRRRRRLRRRPEVNALQERIAAMLGKEAALFMPSGTQSNLCALMSHCQRGDEYLVGQYGAHLPLGGGRRRGAAAASSRSRSRTSPTARCALADIEANIKPDDAHFARTRLLCLENTLGGKPMPLDYLEAATRAGAEPRAGHAPRRRAPVQRRGRAGGDAAGRARARSRAISTASRSASARAWARRSARRWSARASCIARAHRCAQDGRRRHAPGRRARRRGAARARAPRRPAGRRPRQRAPPGRRAAGHWPA